MELIEKIMEMYYLDIYKYCYAKLGYNKTAAEDCTQEVFLIMHKKRKFINLDTSIRAWLYRTADFQIKAYFRKNQNIMVDIDECEIPYSEDFTGENESAIDILNTEELNIVTDYYSGEDKQKVAGKYNLSLNALYIKISRIKKKLEKFMENKQ